MSAIELLFLRTRDSRLRSGKTYTSTGVRAPCVTEQHTAPAKANLEYNATPLSFSGVFDRAVWTTASTFVEPVEVGDAAAIARCVYMRERSFEEWRGDV